MKRPIPVVIICLFSSTLFAQIPQSPSNLVISPSSGTSTTTINLNWTDNASNETGFIIYRADNNSEFVPIASVAANGTTYADAGLNTTHTYKYAVSALSANAESEPWYQQGNISTPAACGTTYCYPEACTGIYPANQDYIKTIEANCTNCVLGITFNRFGADGDSDQLTVYDGNSVNAPSLGTYTSNTIPTNLQATGTKLTIRFKTNGYSDPVLSTGWSITTSCLIRPQGPGTITVDKIYSSMVRLNWSDNNADEDNYKIFYSTSPIFKTFQSITTDPNTTSYIVNSLDSVTTYYFRIQANKGNLPSLKWPVANAKTKGTPFKKVPIPDVKITDSRFFRVADLNNDKLLDFATINHDNGQENIYVYMNSGSGSFTLQKLPLDYYMFAPFELADIDHDKDVDIIYSTYEYIPPENIGVVAAFINNNGTFTKKTLIRLPSYYYLGFEKIAVVDYDNDGIEDIMGYNDMGRNVTFYKYNRNSEYSVDSANYFTDILTDDITIKDINDDQLVDLLIQGKAYVNRGKSQNFRFVYDATMYLPYSYYTLTGDLDDDGDMDLITIGNGVVQVAKKENNSFEHYVTSVDEGISFASDGVISDWDSDGDQDIVYPNGNGGGVLINDGELHFKPLTNFFFEGDPGGGVVRVDDWDNDGDTDVLMYSVKGGAELNIWLNKFSEGNNQKPASPTALTSTINDGSVTLQWQKSVDDHTPLPQYNYYIGKSPGNEDNRPSMSHQDNGQLKVPAMRLVAGTSVVINNLENGTYTWGVQAIDAMGKASTFSTSTFQITDSHFVKAPTDLKVQSYSPYEADVSWTDQSTNETGFVILRTTPMKDGYRPIATLPANTTSYRDNGLRPAMGYSYRIYAIAGADRSALSPVVNYATLNLFQDNTGPIEFTTIANSNNPSDIKWMDINGDNRRDITISNYGSSNATSPFKVLTQSATDPWKFEELQTNLSEKIGQCTHFGWDDFDSDGDLDLVAIGRAADYNQYALWVFQNNGANQFTRFLLDPIANETSLDLGDYDSDGDTDFVVSTWGTVKVYFNNGNFEFGLFKNISVDSYNYASWFDFDNDNDLDILINGGTYPESLLAVYENDGTSFTLKKSFSIAGTGQASIMDGDNDGDEDIARAGAIVENDRINNTFVTRNAPEADVRLYWTDFNNDNKVDLIAPKYTTYDLTFLYKNNGGLTNFSKESWFWGSDLPVGMTMNDVDGDSDLDFIGIQPINHGSSAESFWVLSKNNSKVVRPKPQTPTGLSSQIVDDNTAELSWTAFEVAKNLTYNVRVGTGPGKQNILSSISDLATGFHKTNQIGNARYASKKLIKKLDDGIYYWSVQSIDLSFQASVFATEQVFMIGNPTLGKAHIASATAITSKRIDIAFDNVPANAQTVVFVSENGQPFVTATVTSSTTYTYWGKPETSYDFKIVYIKDNGLFSEESDVVNVTTPKQAKIVTDNVPDVNEGQSFTLSTDQFTVQDATGYPTGYSVKIGAGNHYTINGGSVVPETDYAGELKIKTWVVTNIDSSEVYTVSVNVISTQNPAISGVSIATATEDVSFEITTSDITATHAPGYPTGYSLEILPGDHYTVSGNTIVIEPDFFGNLSVKLKISNGPRTSDPYTTTIAVSAVDDPFKPFALLSPANNATVKNIVHFDWEDAIDVDTPGPISYSLLINTSTPVTITTSESKLDMDLSLYEALWNGEYSWSVTAHNQDGQLESDQRITTFLFNRPLITSVKSLSTQEDVAITIQLSDLTVTHDSPFHAEYHILLGKGDGYTVSGATISPQENFTLPLHVPVQVVNATDTSTIFIATINIIPVNDPPSAFNLLTPTDNSVLNGDINFTWSKSVDVDGDVLLYDLILTSTEGTYTFSDIGTESFQVIAAEFPDLVNNEVTWKVVVKDPSGLTQQSTQQFTYTSIVTGLEPDPVIGVIYPNPATRQLYFNNDNPSVRAFHIFDMKGVRMHTRELTHTGEYLIDVSDYANGLYLIRLISNDGEKVLKFEKR